mgnify:CR=1 FL=1
MVRHNFMMPSSRDCTEQKRKQTLSCNSMEGLIPLVENGRFFDASMIRCRIDLLTYWFIIVWKCSCNLIKKYPCKEVYKHICIDAIRFTFLSYDNKTYDMQEYIFVHPEEWHSRKTHSSGFFSFSSFSIKKMSRSLEALRLQPLGEPPQCFQWY